MVSKIERRKLADRSGFTIAELIVYLLLGVIIIGGVYQVLIGQNRLYVKQRELQDVRGTLRAAGNLLAFELRQASAADSDLYSIGTNSFAVRSLRASAIVCGIDASQTRLGLYAISGDSDLQAGDSALLFSAGASGSGDDAWLFVSIDTVWTSGGGVPFCSWGDTATTAPERVVHMDTVPGYSGVPVGAPFRVFQRAEYALYQEDGRWWLGRKVGSELTYAKLIGPMRSPSDSGLVLTYYDRFGATTSIVTDVRMVDIILRAESYGRVPSASGPMAQEDTLSIRVSLRG